MIPVSGWIPKQITTCALLLLPLFSSSFRINSSSHSLKCFNMMLHIKEWKTTDNAGHPSHLPVLLGRKGTCTLMKEEAGWDDSENIE